MKIFEGPLPGVYRVQLKRLSDARGCFVKTYARSLFAAAGIEFDLREEYYSVPQKGVIRGMHFQIPPHDHVKIVYCALGAVRDVLLDIRSGPGYGRLCTFDLTSTEPDLLVIPKGVAHGFESLTDDSLMVYKTSTEYAPDHDRGIRWDSFGFRWEAPFPIISERDQKHPALVDFASPF